LTTDRITLPELEQYLAKAADLLRGSIDQADFKAYIFPLMFFKRISDVYAEEFAAALAESDGDYEFAAFAENHRFAINQNTLEPKHAQQLLDAYREFTDQEGLARVVDLDEIAANDHNLNIPLYVSSPDTGETLTLADALAHLESAQTQAAQTRAALETELVKWGLRARA
jgi:type I restriction-modification system DNA methylase subunit